VSSGERYVLAAYAVVLATVLLYLVIIALKVSRLERDLGELARLARERAAEREEPAREEAAVG
jgi:type II secretory pathway component PulM